MGNIEVGVGFIYPQRVVEFQIAVIPEALDIQNGVNVLEQTRLSGIDAFTSSFVGSDIAEESVSIGTVNGSFGGN